VSPIHRTHSENTNLTKAIPAHNGAPKAILRALGWLALQVGIDRWSNIPLPVGTATRDARSRRSIAGCETECPVISVHPISYGNMLAYVSDGD
jgi:hypothetical protein